MHVNLNLGICNANGLSSHVNEISIFIKTNEIDIMLISETHFTSKSYNKVVGYDIIRSDDEQAKAFAQHLHSVFQPNDIDNPQTEREVDNLLESPCQMSFPIRKISINEVSSEIKWLNSKKAPGWDKKDGITLKILPPKCVRFLMFIFNAMLRVDHFPSQWKCAEIIMILKPNKGKNEVTKVFEKIILKRMLPIWEEFAIISEHQFGFRKGHGTPKQCHRIINEILSAFESKKYCTATFLDVQQAFDRVWHNGLLYKIKKWVPAPYFLLLKSYLTIDNFMCNTKLNTRPCTL